jgi:small nuclear ribonucleoprotein (snRNP)-like protein
VKKLLRLRLRRRCIVTLKTGDSFSGVLYAADSEAIVLREAEAVGMGEKRTNLVVDGEVLILRDDVAYVQLP